jgi:hypothetical protein
MSEIRTIVNCEATSRPRPSFRSERPLADLAAPPTRRRTGQHRGALRSKRSPMRAAETTTPPNASRSLGGRGELGAHHRAGLWSPVAPCGAGTTIADGDSAVHRTWRVGPPPAGRLPRGNQHVPRSPPIRGSVTSCTICSSPRGQRGPSRLHWPGWITIPPHEREDRQAPNGPRSRRRWIRPRAPLKPGRPSRRSRHAPWWKPSHRCAGHAVGLPSTLLPPNGARRIHRGSLCEDAVNEIFGPLRSALRELCACSGPRVGNVPSQRKKPRWAGDPRDRSESSSR